MKTQIRPWEKQEIILKAENEYCNPYMDVDVWVDLKGPGFDKRVYGFWNGGNEFVVRIVAISGGSWQYVSGSNQDDAGLNGKTAFLEAIDWAEEEKAQNQSRRGVIRATSDGHSFMYADATPYYLLADTWWGLPTYRYPWYEDDDTRDIGPEMGFKDMVQYRKKQGFNAIAILAAYPTWATDGLEANIRMEDEQKTCIRSAWKVDGHVTPLDPQKYNTQAKDMHNEGGRPFLFPGKVEGYTNIVPDFERINPEYFKHMDKKIDYLTANGFTSFIEVARRDVSEVWKNYGGWPDTYARYIHYIYCRYHANNTLFSPIHFDSHGSSIESREYNKPINLQQNRYGRPPFGTLVGTNAGPSTIANFGGDCDDGWLTFDQLGNWRHHDNYWYLTEMYEAERHKPALNGEPYYPGFPDDNPEADSETAELYCRSGMYGSFLSGGLAGYMYGVEGMWGCERSKNARYKMWESISFKSASQVRYLAKFVMCQGARYQKLRPLQEMVTPNKSGPDKGFTGWAYCASTPQKDFILLYFEKGCPDAYLRSVHHDAAYIFKWYNPRNGEWLDDGNEKIVVSDQMCRIKIPDYPGEGDWAACLLLNELLKHSY
jgi:hypothetical protein